MTSPTHPFRQGDLVRVADGATSATAGPVIFEGDVEAEIVGLTSTGEVVVRGPYDDLTVTQTVAPEHLTKVGEALSRYPIGSRVQVTTDGVPGVDPVRERQDHTVPLSLYLPNFTPGDEAEVLDVAEDVRGYGPLLRVCFDRGAHDGGVVRFVRTVQVRALPEPEAAPAPEVVVPGFERGDVVTLAEGWRGVDEDEPHLWGFERVVEGSAMFLRGPDSDGDLVIVVTIEDEDGDLDDEVVYVDPRFVEAAVEPQPWPPVPGQVVEVRYGSSAWDGPATVVEYHSEFRVDVRPLSGPWEGVRGTFALATLRPIED